jgi:hypothetical protein
MTENEERRANCIHYQKTVDDLKAAVFGNGRPGLKEEVQNMKQRLTGLLWLNSIVVIAIITAVVKLFMG